MVEPTGAGQQTTNSPTTGTPSQPASPQVGGAKNENTMQIATFGAGCFWGVEYIFQKIPGVTATSCGYAGGKTLNPTYEDVCSHTSGHAEVVQVTFDPAKVSYAEIVSVFFRLHDPTQVNRQGPDIGDQYRSVIFYHSPEQAAEANRKIADLTAKKKFAKPIATKVEPAPTFYKAEDYHQDYYKRTGKAPYCHFLREEEGE